jgi:hypothetical protein
MNAIATSPSLHVESVIYVFSFTLESDLPRIVSIEKRDNTYNGFRHLYDAFMDLIPEQTKVPENDDHIVRLYHDVRRAMRITQECPFPLTPRTSEVCSSLTSSRLPQLGGRRLRWS